MRKPVLLICALCLVMLLSSSSFAQPQAGTSLANTPLIRITNLTNQAGVQYQGNAIEVTLTSPVPNNDHLILFIRDPGFGWWSYINPDNVRNSRNNWRFNNVQFGQPNEVGRHFRLMLVICSDDELNNGVNTGGNPFSIAPGNRIMDGQIRPFFDSKPNAMKSAPITVVRQ